MGSLKTDDGKPDTMEIYSVGQDDMIGTSPPYENPEPIEAHRQDFQAFFRHAYAAVCVILSHLDKKLGLAPNTLASLNPQDKPTATALRLLLSPPQSNPEEVRGVIPGHTDISSITMLFHVAGGLQILPAGCENEEENWRYVRPEPNCALINLGDTIVEMTGGVLRSSLHRVVTPPGEQARVTRQSLAYLVKPDRMATMRRVKSSGVVPPPSEHDKEDTRSVDEWAAERSRQIIMGEVKPKGRGGRFDVKRTLVKV
jgi:isopenicillin N synthase-like dioxygenase